VFVLILLLVYVNCFSCTYVTIFETVFVPCFLKQFDNDYNQKQLLNQTNQAILQSNKKVLAAVKELVRQVSSLVKIIGEKPTSVPAAKGTSGC
jgi:hypothetical protein